MCWGRNLDAELGTGNATLKVGISSASMGFALKLANVGGLVRTLVLGSKFTCALLVPEAGGVVKCVVRLGTLDSGGTSNPRPWAVCTA